jgi:hypothetical protein
VFAPAKPFRPSLLFVGKASSLAPERCFTCVDSCLAHKHYIILEGLQEMNTILLQIFVTYGRKMFYKIGPWWLKLQYILIFLFFITSVFRHLWQLKTTVFLHTYLLHYVLSVEQWTNDSKFKGFNPATSGTG